LKRQNAYKNDLGGEKDNNKVHEMKRTILECFMAYLRGLMIILPALLAFVDGASPQDLEKKEKDFIQSLRTEAEKGDIEAQRTLGIVYSGDLPPHDLKDYREAFKWFSMAAKKGDSASQLSLGTMYQEGEGVLQDYTEAVRWYRMAAEQGAATAYLALGHMYALGRGVSQDKIRAYMWYNLAAANLDYESARRITMKFRDSIAKLMTPAQIAEAQKMSQEWKPKKRPIKPAAMNTIP
jgi:hypothetical protein